MSARHRRTTLLLVAVGALSVLTPRGWADQDPHVHSTGSVSAPVSATVTGTVVKSTTGKVWAVTVTCPTAPCEVGLFDDTAVVAGNAKWEQRVATANDSKPFSFRVPLNFDNGIIAQVSSNGTAFVEFE